MIPAALRRYNTVMNLDHLRDAAKKCHDCEAESCRVDGPVDADIPSIARAFANADIRRAFALIRQATVLPEMHAQLCPSLTTNEGACIETRHGRPPVPIRAMQMAVSCRARDMGLTRIVMPESRSDNTVAIVGGGPCGVACAVRVLEKGHDVVIFEKEHELGGVPNSAIRASRYAETQTAISAILQPALDAGALEIRFGEEVGNGVALRDLVGRYDAVLLAAGLAQEQSIGKAEGVVDAMTFLKDAKQGRRKTIPRRVAVLAGGDSAMDAAVVALELGATELRVVYGGSIAEMHWHMPDDWFETSGAICNDLTQPLGYEIDETGKLVGIRVRRMERDSDEVSILPVDFCVEAMGLQVSEALKCELGAPWFTAEGLIVTGEDGPLATGTDMVFAAGALINGGTSIGQCVTEGMQAAEEIDKSLRRRNASLRSKAYAEAPDSGDGAAIRLESCRKTWHGRCEKPENTVARLETIIGARYDYSYYEEKVSDDMHWSALFIDEPDFRSMGKGIEPILSKAGALAEAAEWLSSVETHEMPGYVECHQDEIESAVRIEDLVSHVSTVTPSVLDRIKGLHCAQHWVDGFSLIDRRVRKVPIRFVRRICASNGLAAGNRLEEAIVHATNEVFERRAHITVLKQRLVVPTIDITSIEHPVIRSQIDFVQGKGINVTLKDLSFGGELPCIGAYFEDPSIPPDYQFHHFFKVGASSDREQALIRTFTEFAQGRRADEFIDGTREEQERILQHDFRSLKCMPEDDDNYVSAFLFGFVPMREAEFLKEGDVLKFERGMCFDDCLDDIDEAKRICGNLVKDYVIIDMTDPGIGFPVVQVVIPSYSDILPYHPSRSEALFENWTRDEAIRSYSRDSS